MASDTSAQVATRRTRTAGKVEIPNVDDHVSKLELMGKETVKKLQDIHGAAIGSGIDISVPTNCINKGATADRQSARAAPGIPPNHICDTHSRSMQMYSAKRHITCSQRSFLLPVD